MWLQRLSVCWWGLGVVYMSNCEIEWSETSPICSLFIYSCLVTVFPVCFSCNFTFLNSPFFLAMSKTLDCSSMAALTFWTKIAYFFNFLFFPKLYLDLRTLALYNLWCFVWEFLCGFFFFVFWFVLKQKPLRNGVFIKFLSIQGLSS